MWLFREILQKYSPKVVSVEHNSNFPIDRAITFRHDREDTKWQNDKVYGSSLKALNIVGEEFGYTVVYVLAHFDVLFIRNDLIKDRNIPVFNSFKNNTSIVCHRVPEDSSRISNFLDYEVYLQTGGDIEKSVLAAQDVCRKYILATEGQLMPKANLRNRINWYK